MATNKDERADERQVSLETMNGGAAVELFNDELQKVLDNIGDPNTKPDTVREITLKVKIKPNEKRRFADVSLQVTSKLAPVRETNTVFWLGKDPKTKQVVASERNMDQMTLDEIPTETKPAPVQNISERGGK